MRDKVIAWVIGGFILLTANIFILLPFAAFMAEIASSDTRYVRYLFFFVLLFVPNVIMFFLAWIFFSKKYSFRKSVLALLIVLTLLVVNYSSVLNILTFHYDLTSTINILFVIYILVSVGVGAAILFEKNNVESFYTKTRFTWAMLLFFAPLGLLLLWKYKHYSLLLRSIITLFYAAFLMSNYIRA